MVRSRYEWVHSAHVFESGMRLNLDVWPDGRGSLVRARIRWRRIVPHCVLMRGHVGKLLSARMMSEYAPPAAIILLVRGHSAKRVGRVGRVMGPLFNCSSDFHGKVGVMRCIL